MTIKDKLFKAGLIGVLTLTGCALEEDLWDKPLESKPAPEWSREEPKKLIWEKVKIAEINSPTDTFNYLTQIEYVNLQNGKKYKN